MSLFVITVLGFDAWVVHHVLSLRPDVATDPPPIAIAAPPVTAGTGPKAPSVQPSPVPSPSVVEQLRPGPAVPKVDASWVSAIAAKTGIPARALTAYADAQLATALSRPGCHLWWTMLAGIGEVESSHGTFGGATLLDDGTTSKPIIGPPLNGSNHTAAIPATPQGQLLHGDARWEHAVGPMQFIESTWAHYAVSASGGVPNPNDIDDAALTAGRYLCAAGGNLATAQGWRAAVHAYNAPTQYEVHVTELANRYAAESLS